LSFCGLKVIGVESQEEPEYFDPAMNNMKCDSLDMSEISLNEFLGSPSYTGNYDKWNDLIGQDDTSGVGLTNAVKDCRALYDEIKSYDGGFCCQVWKAKNRDHPLFFQLVDDTFPLDPQGEVDVSINGLMTTV
jgi:hypothetical protein